MSAHSPHSSGDDSDSDDGDFAASSGSERGASPGAGGAIAEAAPLDDDEAEALRADAEEAGEVVSGRRRRGAAQHDDTAEVTALSAGREEESSDALWAKFQAANAAEETAARPSVAKPEEMIAVPRTFKFAGKTETKTEMLPASHPDAVAFLASQRNAAEAAKADASDEGAATSSGAATASSEAVPAAAGSSASASSSAHSPAPPARLTASGPRKRKAGGLAAAAAAAAGGKVAKLSTLEKSKLDWEAYKSGQSASSASSPLPPSIFAVGEEKAAGAGEALSEQEREEMEAQTRGGARGLGNVKGFIERKEFLDRVRGRLEG